MKTKTIFKSLALSFLFAACAGHAVDEKNEPTEALSVSCLGPEDAHDFMIYLHGMDTPTPSKQELANRAVLESIAKKKNIRIALPRARMKCPTQNGSICWAWKFGPSEMSVLQEVVDSRTQCFPDKKPFSMIGFSNGGYLVTHAYVNGIFQTLKPAPTGIIASGSAKGQISEEMGDLSKNPKLVLVIGNQDDYNYDPTESFYYQLQSVNAPVGLVEFQGGHVLNEEAILKVLEAKPQHQDPRQN